MSQFATTAMLGEIDVAAKVASTIRPAIDAMNQVGVIRQHTGFGYAVSRPDPRPADLDNPEKFVWFVAGWGEKWQRYAANAVRKMRPALRYDLDTLDMRSWAPSLFEDEVESADEDGNFPWGDFPWGGAVWHTISLLSGPDHLLVAVSALRQEEDDWVARMIAGIVGVEILRHAGKLSD